MTDSGRRSRRSGVSAPAPMQVGRWMTTEVVAAEAQDPLERAQQLLRQHQIRHLPVTQSGRLVGIATEQDLRIGGEPSS